MIMTGIFILPNLCESYLSMNAKIVKSHQTDKRNLRNKLL